METIKRLNNQRYQQSVADLNDQSVVFERAISHLMENDLPVSVDWFKKVDTLDKLKDFLFEEMNANFSGYMPRDLKNQVKAKYYNIAVDCGKDVEVCANVVRNYPVVADGNGKLHIDKPKAEKRLLSDSMELLNADLLSKGASILFDFAKAVEKFKQDSTASGFPLPGSGLMFRNDEGGAGFVDWDWLMRYYNDNPNTTQEDCTRLAEKLFYFQCVV